MNEENKCPKRNKPKSQDDMIQLTENVNRFDDLKFNRRAFLKTAVGATVALGLSTLPFSVKAFLGDFEDEKELVEIVKLDSLPPGSSVTFNYPTENDPALLVHTKAGELKAYNSACTHLMCPVFYEKESEVLLCPCHKGYFDLNNGHPLAGPPQRELPLIELEVQNEVVYAVGRKIRHG
ncbi:ubiquinol-cytochrome c reductase iron-sulfur subunit [Halalkalibacter akibai]|uniref:Rieske n=1 Tax=Halalkalibacter akibai (strain ATCC 43226 / DSM 21942 / CIP 109018 / JCM 9157 / 1139) TaxID=1236973 RepID=W4QV30_HALA3|nr:Rieske 2Fe-2S domain-containing protein [Halalkalibacter akibai]GAE35194.1 Rieske [Halalkalibacter akibai JCM 9157]